MAHRVPHLLDGYCSCSCEECYEVDNDNTGLCICLQCACYVGPDGDE